MVDILEILMRSEGRIVSRDELTALLYQRESTPYERSLDVHISHLRKKLDGADRTLIQRVRARVSVCAQDGAVQMRSVYFGQPSALNFSAIADGVAVDRIRDGRRVALPERRLRA